MSMQELKDCITRGGLSFDDCLEKAELQQRAREADAVPAGSRDKKEDKKLKKRDKSGKGKKKLSTAKEVTEAAGDGEVALITKVEALVKESGQVNLGPLPESLYSLHGLWAGAHQPQHQRLATAAAPGSASTNCSWMTAAPGLQVVGGRDASVILAEAEELRKNIADADKQLTRVRPLYALELMRPPSGVALCLPSWPCSPL